MAKSPKSFLLEQLRAQADAVAAKRMQRLKLSREVVDRIDQRMHYVFQYFDEACKLLQVISPPVERSFELPHIVRYEGLHLEKASVTFRKQRLQDRDVYDYVVVYYSLAGPQPAPLRVAIRRSPEIERALVSAHIEFTCDTDSTVQSGATYNVIRIAPGLRCEARFDPDFENGRIVATLRNVDRFEPVVLDFETPALDTKALDDLVNFMLAKPSGFLLRAPLRGFVR
ncbi:MAG: hypothetical protein AUH79_06980 [Betaproteobacteria bacterium 13_1_40CM_4_64_4]|nr:MAG: hypothetical protein AUH79_06980 [Betaproteobacteria bacterium 13_1_40CM_4_64_4]